MFLNISSNLIINSNIAVDKLNYIYVFKFYIRKKFNV